MDGVSGGLLGERAGAGSQMTAGRLPCAVEGSGYRSLRRGTGKGEAGWGDMRSLLLDLLI